jgi:hypothetical protein
MAWRAGIAIFQRHDAKGAWPSAPLAGLAAYREIAFAAKGLMTKLTARLAPIQYASSVLSGRTCGADCA